jgi:hypothetical protein
MFNWMKKLFSMRQKYTKIELKSFNKLVLEEIGRTWGVELDRRETSDKLIKQLLKIMK